MEHLKNLLRNPWFWLCELMAKEKKYDWSPFVAENENPAEFLTDLVVGILTLASFEYGVVKVDSRVIEKIFFQLGREFQFPEAGIVDDDCGYPYAAKVLLSMALARSFPQGIIEIDESSRFVGVPNRLLQHNLWYLRKRGPGFIKALYPVVDRFVEIIRAKK